MMLDFDWVKKELRFEAMPEEVRAVLATVIEKEFVPEGMPIIHQGTSVQNLYLLRSGSVNITQKHGDQEVMLSRANESKTFGEISFFGDDPAAANVVADQPCEVYKISCENFRWLMQEHPDIALKIMAYVVRSMGEIIRGMDSSRVWH